VENEAIEVILKEMGIDYTQGFLKHKPAPIQFLLKKDCCYPHSDSSMIA